MRPLRQLSEARLRERTSVKWSLYPEDVLPLWVAEMDAPLAEPVWTALRRTLDIGDLGYPDGHLYLETFAGFAERHWGWRPHTGTPVADVMTGLRTAIEVSTTPGASVVINPPVYTPFFDVVALAGRELLHAELASDGRLDLDRLDDACAHAGPGSAYLMCNPHNPTATVPTREELLAVASIAAERGVRVIVDEIHGPLAGAEFTPYLSLPGTDSALVSTSASKTFNLAGVKAAILIAGSAAVGDLEKLPELSTHGISHTGLVAHRAAFAHGDEWLAALLRDLDENRALLRELLEHRLPDVEWNGERGSYLGWLRFPERLGPDPAARILDRARVALNGGPSFGPGGQHHARLNYATTPQILEQAVERISEAVLTGRAGSASPSPRP